MGARHEMIPLIQCYSERSENSQPRRPAPPQTLADLNHVVDTTLNGREQRLFVASLLFLPLPCSHIDLRKHNQRQLVFLQNIHLERPALITMCKDSVTHEFLTALPKCEHHIHIEGSLLPETLFTLAARNNMALPPPLPSDDPKLSPSAQPIFPVDASAYASASALSARYKVFSGLDDFLAYYYRGMSTLLSAADFTDLAWAYLTKAHADGVRHAEIFFDPQAHVARGVSLATVVAGLTAACRRAESELGLTTLLIACFLRHLPQSDALALAASPDFAEAVRSKAIVGVGLDSSESGFPPALFADVYRAAQAMGLRCTAHAGEEGPAANIAASLATGPEGLSCERIDHGIRLAEDDALLAEVASKGTLLTVCPLSNVYLRCVSSVGELPLRRFLKEGVKFSINSDDPAYLGGFILENYCAVQEAFGLTRAEWRGICEAGIEGSWCQKERKDELMGLLDRVFNGSIAVTS